MHTFTISTAKFNQTQVTPNPSVTVTGSVDSVGYIFATTWNEVQYAQASGQTAAVQSVMQAIMLNTLAINRLLPVQWGYSLVEIPKFSTSASIPTPAFDRNGGWVDVQEILNCGTWTA